MREREREREPVRARTPLPLLLDDLFSIRVDLIFMPEATRDGVGLGKRRDSERKRKRRRWCAPGLSKRVSPYNYVLLGRYVSRTRNLNATFKLARGKSRGTICPGSDLRFAKRSALRISGELRTTARRFSLFFPPGFVGD